MANLFRGEIEAEIAGVRRTLCLTLGALAELEAQLATGDLVGLGERFAAGRISARDLIAIIGAGLRGAGHPISNEELASMPFGGGVHGAATIAAQLLKATFGDSSETAVSADEEANRT